MRCSRRVTLDVGLSYYSDAFRMTWTACSDSLDFPGACTRKIQSNTRRNNLTYWSQKRTVDYFCKVQGGSTVSDEHVFKLYEKSLCDIFFKFRNVSGLLLYKAIGSTRMTLSIISNSFFCCVMEFFEGVKCLRWLKMLLESFVKHNL